MPGFSAGSAYVSVVPSLDGFKKKIQADTRAMFASGLQIKVTPDFDAAGLNSAATAATKAAAQTVKFTADFDSGSAVAQASTAAKAARQTVHFGTDLDTGAARGEAVAAARTMGQKVNFKVDLDRNSLSQSVVGVAALSRSLRTIALPAALIAATPAVLSLASSLTQAAGAAAVLPAVFASVGAGAATMIMGLSGIGEAFKQLSAQDDAAATTAASAGGARKAALDSVRSAQNALADAQRSADREAEQSAWQVADARQAVADAVESGNRQVQSSEQDLAAAQDAARRAQQALTQARADARDELRQLQFSVEGAMYAEQDAADRLQQARADLANAQQNKAGAEDIQDLTREVGKADLALREASYKYKQLRAEGKQWADTGIEGSQRVRDAQRQVVDANKGVGTAERAVADARIARDRDVTNARVQLSRTIIQTGQQQADAARSVQQATEALAQAQAGVGAAGAAGASKASAAMGKLSPVAQNLVRQVRALGPAWKSVQLGVQDRLLAGLASKITALSSAYLPGLRTQLFGLAEGYNLAARNAAGALLAPQTVADTNTGLGNMTTAVRISTGAVAPLIDAFRDLAVVGSSFLPGMATGLTNLAVRFRNFIAQARQSGQLRVWIQNGITVLRQLWQLVVNVGSIFKSVFAAVDRTGQSFLTTLVQITGRAAAALRTPEGATGLQSVLGTIRDLTGAFFGKLVQLWPVIQATAQAFMVLGQMLSPVFQLLSWITPVLGPFAAAALAIATATKIAALAQAGWTAAVWAFDAAWAANPIGVIVLAIAGIVAAIIYCLNNFSWFRTAVVAVWNAIKVAISFAWNNILKPVFAAIGVAVQALGRVFTWLWQNILRPIFTVIGMVARVLASILIAVVIVPIIGVVRLLGAVFGWLWRNVLQPVFRAIGVAAQWVWNTILRPVFNGFMAVLRGVGRVFNWLWLNILKPVWDAISGAIKWAWDNVLKPVFNAFRTVGQGIGKAFTKMKDVVVGVWDTIVDIVKTPIQAVINVIWNNSLRWLFEKASKVPVVGDLVPDFLTKRIDLARGGVVQPGAAQQAAGLTPMPGNKATVVDPDTWRVIGDRPRGREYFIPEDGSPNSLAILAQAAAAFGRQLVPMAKGGILALATGAALTTGAGTAGAAVPGGAAKVVVSGVTGAAKDASKLEGTVGSLGATLSTLGTATDAYKTKVTDLASGALTPLQNQLTGKTAAALRVVATQTGVKNVAAVTKLRNTLPSLGTQQVRTGATTRTAWQQTTNKVVANQNTMQARQNRLTTGMRTGWNTIASSTQQSVNRQRGAYGGLQQGMANTRSAMTHTASWAQIQYGRMYAAAAGPARRTITGPLNGLVRVWNRLAGDFNMKPKVKALIPGFATGGDLEGPGTGTSDSFLIRASDGEFMVREKIASLTRPFLRALNAGQPEAIQAAGGYRAKGPDGYARGGDINQPARNDAIMRATKFARRESGKPYIWGGVGPAGYDCCISGPVRIYGPDGALPISEVRPGYRVYSYVEGRCEVHTVTAAWQSKRQPVFAVRTRNRTVTASANHPFLVLREAEPARHVKGGRRGEQVPARYDTTWARLDELQRGDLLVQPRAMAADEKPTAVLSDGTVVDADVAWLLGTITGDGTVTDKGLRLALYGERRDRAAALLTDRWGSRPGYRDDAGLVVSSVALRDALIDLGMRQLGPDKRVPDAVWTWGAELRRAYLDGYCDADGHRPADPAKHGDRTYASASRELIGDIRAMHVMLGDPTSNISTAKRTKPITIKGKLVKNARDLHTCTVWPGEGRGEAAVRRRPGIASWLDAGDFTVARVLGIEAQGEEDTWDLEVAGAHNFVADGVVVHNSGFMSAITNVLRGVNPHQRLGVARSQPWAGFQRGMKGAFTTGFSSVHTAGTLAGVNVESGGSPSRVKYGVGAAGADDSQFPGHAWLPMVGGRFVSGGGAGSMDPASIIGPAFDGVGKQIRALTDAFPGNRAARTGAAEARKASKGIQKFATIKLQDALMSSDVGGSGVQRWAPMVHRALNIMGLPQSNAARTLRRMGQESGGDPKIINRWDSNWAKGTPSVGLMQVIRGTYQSYKHPKFDVGPYAYGVSMNPLANTLASMGYAIGHYGSLASAYDRPGGYDNGGLAYGAGFMAKYINEPERTLNPSNTKSFDTLVHMIRTGRLNLGDDGGDGSSGGPLIGEMHQHFSEGVSASGAMDEALFELRRVRRSGRG